MFVRRVWLHVCSIAFLALSAYAQGDFATLTGRVTDKAESVVPGVKVSVINVDTGIARTMVTTDTGDYTITNLPPGHYELVAEREGFHKYHKIDIVLETGESMRADVPLEIGSVTETVNVTAQVAVLNTENGTIKGDVIVQQEIQNLPLDGRDFTDLAFLVPGVAPAAQGGQGSALAINGARADSTNFVVDGFDNRNSRGAAAQVRPNIDAMQEFKMEVGGYSAEYGRMAGGILNMVLKSGTNQFHGVVFEYVRNNIIDSRSFFDENKVKLIRNQFGATMDGPLSIPKLYNGHNRTFYMFSWESYRQIQGETSLAHVPTDLERIGDLSQTLSQLNKKVVPTDPFNKNAPFPGSIIPSSRFDPIAQRILAFYPHENRPGQAFNFTTAINDRDAFDSFIWKIDHRFSDKDSAAFRYQVRFNPTSTPFAGNPLGLFGDQVQDNRSLLGVDFTHLFSPTFLIEWRGGFSRNSNTQNSTAAGIDYAQQLGIPGTTTEPSLLGFPLINLLGYSPMGGAADEPVQYAVTTIQTGVKMTWVKSKHVMKWGFDLEKARFNQPFYNNNRGTFAVQDKWTGLAMGDFLLGELNNDSRTVGWTRNYMRYSNYGGFFNDDFKVHPHLTLNLGVRYEIDTPPTDRYGRMANFVPGLNQVVVASNATIPDLDQLVAQAGLTGAVIPRSQTNLPDSLVFTDRNNFAPRVGFAWRPFGATRTVIRGGYGIFYTGSLENPVRTSLMTGFPFSTNETYTRLAAQPTEVTFSNPFPVDRLALGGVNNTAGFDTHAPTGYLQSYNLTVERDLGAGIVVEVGYVGSKGTHLGRLYNINIPQQSLQTYLAGIPVAALRPIPIFNTVNYYEFGVNSIYNAGQITLRKRGRGGLFYRLNYSYSKSIDEASQITGNSDGGFAGAEDPRNLKLERGRSDWDRGHVVTANFSWQAPFGRGQHFLSSAHGFVQGALGGWNLSGTASFATGSPITVLTNGSLPNVGEFPRPNRIAKGIPVDQPGKRGVDYPWFDLNAFQPSPACISVAKGCPADAYGFLPFQDANSGRNILDGPGYQYINMALMKNFPVKERKVVQFRLESFNIFNHPNLMLPDNNFNTTTAGLISQAVETGRGGPRVFQASLKFMF